MTELHSDLWTDLVSILKYSRKESHGPVEFKMPDLGRYFAIVRLFYYLLIEVL